MACLGCRPRARQAGWVSATEALPPDLCFLTRENDTPCSATPPAKDAFGSDLGVASQGHKALERRSTTDGRSADHSPDGHRGSASPPVSAGAFSRLACIVATLALVLVCLTRVIYVKKQSGKALEKALICDWFSGSKEIV